MQVCSHGNVRPILRASSGVICSQRLVELIHESAIGMCRDNNDALWWITYSSVVIKTTSFSGCFREQAASCALVDTDATSRGLAHIFASSIPISHLTHQEVSITWRAFVDGPHDWACERFSQQFVLRWHRMELDQSRVGS